MRKLIVASVALLLCGILASTAYSISRGEQDQDPSDADAYVSRDGFEFEYQFGILDEDGEARYVAQMPTLASGERFTVRLRAKQPSFAYLFVSDGSGHYALMAPSSQDDDGLATKTARQRWITLPDEDAVMRLDERRGVERVYLVVAPRRVAEIERLADARDELSVSEDWLIELRNRVGAKSRWTRQQVGASVRATYSGAAVVALEDASFRHE